MHRSDHCISQIVTLDGKVLRPNAARQSHIKIRYVPTYFEKKGMKERNDPEVLSP